MAGLKPPFGIGSGGSGGGGVAGVTVTTVSAGDTTLSGRGPAGATFTPTKNGGALSAVTVAADGTWSLALNPAASAGDAFAVPSYSVPSSASSTVPGAPAPPSGYTYFADPDGSRLTDADGAYLMEAA